MITPATIVAPATPHGVGGIAVIRLSGSTSYSIGKKLFKVALDDRFATYVKIYGLSGNIIDLGIATFFKKPRSYTGEDILEISCHGNPVIVQRVVETCTGLGARLAEPGEFTRRAFINGKLDLVQVESVGALIQAQSNESASLNMRLLEGGLSKKFDLIKQVLMQNLSLVEFELDISEDDLQPDLKENLHLGFSVLREKLSHLSESYQRGRLLSRGARVVIVGNPNIGKSTLLNRLAGFDRAITSPEPGTTRDPVDVTLVIDGVSVNIVDTAGLREATGEIEKEGVSRTLQYAETADLILELCDPENPDGKNTASSFSASIQKLHVFNKIDLLDNNALSELRQAHPESCFISALSGKGLDILESKIKASLGINRALSSGIALTTARQMDAVKNALSSVNKAHNLLSVPVVEYALVALELHEALHSIDRILGKTTPDDILNNIFGAFCVGK